MGKVLIIDDNKFNAEALCDMVGSLGHEVTCTYTAEEGIKAARSNSYDVVFLDVQLPDGNGLLLLPEIHAMPSAPEVIIITGFGSPDGAELAIKNGAWDFIEKPLERKLIELPLVRALQYRETKKQTRTPLVLKRDGIVGSSPIMRTSMELIAQAAASDANVLITGETGTGKEVFAQAIHDNSLRSGMPFVTVDCASLPPTIIESILFGHEKGAFTGADRIQEGLIKQADGGTLFLDEVGDLPFPAQKAFLRVLQEHCFRPLGARREVRSEFRVIAATNRDLDKMIGEGKIREDLLFRLRAISITLPPLRERPGDIEELLGYYVNKICLRQGKEVKGFSPEFRDALCAYDWPGNIRELINALESALAAALDETMLYPKHLPTRIRVNLIRGAVVKKTDSKKVPVKMDTLKERRDAVFAREERQYLQELMALTEGNIREACAVSGLGRARLYQLIKKHGIAIPE
ncbi:MAG: Fis family transcriptional regulator [Deltaproteobacteria bacterium HGW-Deltaproteobacteria-9]|nr:MAG: Fis family transcriptional regulator [Deltaproteobacteria bacterium HGW-Deltaproteobacteria-9]